MAEGEKERKKEAGMEDEKRLLLSYCCRGALSADEEFSFSSVWYSLATFSSRRKKEGGGGRRRRRERSVIDFRMIDSSRGGRYEPGIDRCKPRRPNRRQLPQQQQQSSSSFGGGGFGFDGNGGEKKMRKNSTIQLRIH